jgi:hypothetical protein
MDLNCGHFVDVSPLVEDLRYCTLIVFPVPTQLLPVLVFHEEIRSQV